jgi:hypothetical protein
LCGPPTPSNNSFYSQTTTTKITTTSEGNKDVMFEVWSRERGYDFTFSQELASGVPINRKEANIGVGIEGDMMKLDLAIELVAAVHALHQSPIGSIAHGDLKVKDIGNQMCLILTGHIYIYSTHAHFISPTEYCYQRFHRYHHPFPFISTQWSNIITHPRLPQLQLIDFDNAIVLPSFDHDVEARRTAFCCDMGKVMLLSFVVCCCLFSVTVQFVTYHHLIMLFC